MAKTIDKRHGGAYDRGSADAYYRRPFDPHYYVAGTYYSLRVELEDMSADELADYGQGFKDQKASGNSKS
jgi:hypothetical protein